MALNLPDLVARLRVDDSDLDKTSAKVGRFGKDIEDAGSKGAKSTGGLTGALGKLGSVAGPVGGAIAGIGVAAVGVGFAFVNTSSRLEALGEKSKTVFGTALPTVQKWADGSAAAMKLTRSEAVGLATNMGDLLIPMGFTREAAAKMSTETVGLAGALSKWSGGTISSADAAGILTDAMLGETDGLKALGISISAAEVDAQLLAKGQDKLTGAALAQAEAQAVQALIFAKSTDAQAGFAAGGETLASRLEGLKVKGKELWEELVIRLTPAAERFADWAINEGVAALQSLGQWISDNREKFRQMAISVLEGSATMLRGLGTMVGGMADFGSAVLGVAARIAGALGQEGLQNQLLSAQAALNRTGDVGKAALEKAAGAADVAADRVQNLGRQEAHPNVSVPGAAPSVAALDRVTGAAQNTGRQNPVVTVHANVSEAERILQQFVNRFAREHTGRMNMSYGLPQGDGPGRPTGGGSTLARVLPMLGRLGGYVTSTYRSPAQNAAAGGSPTSYHMDRANPAVDIGGPPAVLRSIHRALGAVGGWRELLGPGDPGHSDHVHVADQGGVFQGPGYVLMGRGREQFTAGGIQPAEKISSIPASSAPAGGARVTIGVVNLYGSDATPAGLSAELAWRVRTGVLA